MSEAIDLSGFGARLQYALDCAHISQSSVARYIGVSRQTINEMLKTRSNHGGGRHVAAIAEFLKISVEWLAFGTGDPNVLTSSKTESLIRAVSEAQLSSLQVALLEKLVGAMHSGDFSDTSCVEFLADLHLPRAPSARTG